MSGFLISGSALSYSGPNLDGYMHTSSGNLELVPLDGYVNIRGDLQIYGQAFSYLTTIYYPTGIQQTIDWNKGNGQILDLLLATGNVSVDFIHPEIGASYVIKIIQHPTSAKNITWPSVCKWPGGAKPTITVAARAVDMISLYYDGINYYCNSGQDYK